jgi:DNA-binding MarR family transcriptional regulator
VVAPGPSSAELAALFSDLVRLETELWDRVDARLRRDHDLPLSWFEPLQLMDRLPACRVADIAEGLSITDGGASKLVDRLERAGWCSRRANPGDARSSLLRLTPAGRRRLGPARSTFEDELGRSLGAALAPTQLASLATSLRTARRRLAEQWASDR